MKRLFDDLFQCIYVREDGAPDKLRSIRLEFVRTESMNKALISLGERPTVLRIPCKCEASAAVLYQCVLKNKNAEMILHEKKICIDPRHVSACCRIDKKKRDIKSIQHLDIFRVKQLEADDACSFFFIKSYRKA